jgi:D-alanine-D-alanine ligase
MGGRSSEREVSLVSGRSVLAALARPTDAADRRGPARAIAVEILPDGRWRAGPQSWSPAEALGALEMVDLFFTALHGGEGENGAVQGLLTCCDRAFTGSGVIASGVCMDKVFARDLVAARGLRVAAGLVVSKEHWTRSASSVRPVLARLSRSGWVVKPRRGGSSVGCSVVRTIEDLADALVQAFSWEEEALVEALVEGVEVTCGILEEPGGEPVALPPVEIRPRSGDFFDYREKYSPDGALELCPCESLSSSAVERVQAAALEAHRALGCEGYSRSDFLVPSGESEPVFLETNTLPGLTPRSLLPKAAAASGIDYRTLCLSICASGLRRARTRRAG